MTDTVSSVFDVLDAIFFQRWWLRCRRTMAEILGICLSKSFLDDGWPLRSESLSLARIRMSAQRMCTVSPFRLAGGSRGWIQVFSDFPLLFRRCFLRRLKLFYTLIMECHLSKVFFVESFLKVFAGTELPTFGELHLSGYVATVRCLKGFCMVHEKELQPAASNMEWQIILHLLCYTESTEFRSKSFS